MDEKDSFRLWDWVQERRDMAVFWGSLVAVVCVLVLGGCSVVGHVKVEGWPDLKIIEHRVPTAEMRDRCVQYADALSSPMACMEFSLWRGECHIWLSADFPSDSLLEHERLHCRGFDHVGGNTLLRYYDHWQAMRKPR